MYKLMRQNFSIINGFLKLGYFTASREKIMMENCLISIES